jgi:long-chain acyl-CoA synthetase
VVAKYAAEIEELYDSEPGPDVDEPKSASAAQPA